MPCSRLHFLSPSSCLPLSIRLASGTEQPAPTESDPANGPTLCVWRLGGIASLLPSRKTLDWPRGLEQSLSPRYATGRILGFCKARCVERAEQRTSEKGSTRVCLGSRGVGMLSRDPLSASRTRRCGYFGLVCFMFRPWLSIKSASAGSSDSEQSRLG